MSPELGTSQNSMAERYEPRRTRVWRAVLFAGMVLQLCGCAIRGYDRDDDSGLAPTPYDSAIPTPHVGADAPSEMLKKVKRPSPCDPTARYSAAG
ncbi:MAG: hypothetical protein ACHP9T_14925 [Caulobacterales bacterium]